MSGVIVRKLKWRDPVIASLQFPKATMTLRYGFGSGLARRPGDRDGHFWAIGDRGPNIKVHDAIRIYGLDHLAPLAGTSGAKIMPWLEVGPTLAEFRVDGDTIELLRTLPLRNNDGSAVTGLPHADSDQLDSEPVFDMDGKALTPDPNGLDTEGLVALADGGFWVGDEFGPSLVRLDANGTVTERLLPFCADLRERARALPAIAAKRQINRGFEALASSEDERSLFVAFQSPLAHPDEAAHRTARHVRIWQLESKTGRVAAQFAYPLDPPESFIRDNAEGEFTVSDIKVSELLWLPSNALLVLERGSATTKIYRCPLDAEPVNPAHLDIGTRPTLEELSMSKSVASFPVLAKELLFSSDDHPDVSRDIEGMIALSAFELLLVSDNDFSVEGAETTFWRVRLPAGIEF